MKDTQHLLGKLLAADEGTRDAIHIAVLPVICGEKYLSPGDHLKFAYGSKSVVVRARPEYDDMGIGVVDPFLIHTQSRIEEGTRFFMFLYPNTVTGMVHHWNHPVVDGPPPQPANSHEEWMRKFAEKWNFDYDDLIAAATAETGEEDFDNYITARGIDLHRATELGDDHDLFWSHLEAMTGKEYNQEHRKLFGWSCSC